MVSRRHDDEVSVKEHAPLSRIVLPAITSAISPKSFLPPSNHFFDSCGVNNKKDWLKKGEMPTENKDLVSNRTKAQYLVGEKVMVLEDMKNMTSLTSLRRS